MTRRLLKYNLFEAAKKFSMRDKEAIMQIDIRAKVGKELLLSQLYTKFSCLLA